MIKHSFSSKKEALREILLYLSISFVIILSLTLIHYLPNYENITTIDFIKTRPLTHVWYELIDIFFWIVTLIPLLVVFRMKYFGWFFLMIFSIFTAFEKYLLEIQGNLAPWNKAMDPTVYQNFKTELTSEGISTALSTYSVSPVFWIYFVLFAMIIFNTIYLLTLLLRRQSVRTGIISLSGFFIMMHGYTHIEKVPYMFSVAKVLIVDANNQFKNLFIEDSRNKIYFTQINKKQPRPENIIFIMDESIRGDKISINNPRDPLVMKSTPYLYSIKDKLVNFGVNYSTMNCSFGSNLLFMSGINTKSLDMTEPTILQYMQNAGYKTIYINAPMRGMTVGLKTIDQKYVDEYISTNNYSKLERDFKALEILKEKLGQPGKKFIFILKHGAHPPFSEDYPAVGAPLRALVSDSVQLHHYKAYLNALNYTVDTYWKRIVDVIGDTSSVLLWQSDHGVNITPDIGDNQIMITHCEQNLKHYQQMYSVPSVLYTPIERIKSQFKNLENGHSTSQMTSTVLKLAGYKRSDYEKFYGPDYASPLKTVRLRTIQKTKAVSIFNILEQENFIDINSSTYLEESKKISEYNSNLFFAR